MSEQKVPRGVEQRFVIKFLVGENVPSAEIHHRLQQQYGEECLRRRPEFIDGWVTSTQLLGHVIENIKTSNGLINFYLFFIKMTTFLQRIIEDTEVKI